MENWESKYVNKSGSKALKLVSLLILSIFGVMLMSFSADPGKYQNEQLKNNPESRVCIDKAFHTVGTVSLLIGSAGLLTVMYKEQKEKY